MTDRLFDIDDVPEVPLLPEPRRSRGDHDARFRNDYPPDWHRCTHCGGRGSGVQYMGVYQPGATCPKCLGMGSLKGRVRLAAGHRCVRCAHPFMTKGDARMLGVEPTPGRWSPCDDLCTHLGPARYALRGGGWVIDAKTPVAVHFDVGRTDVQAEWRVLTVHHLDGDKANVRWWNLVALCQRDHLEIQSKVMMERIYPHEHSEWFKPYAAGYYAWSYLGEDLSREEVMGRLDELLSLERQA